MTYNKSEIMRTAWNAFKKADMSRWDCNVIRVPYHTESGEIAYSVSFRKSFAECLKETWRQAKSKVADEKAQAAAANNPKVAEIDRALFYLNMKDHWDTADFDRANRLNAERRAILAEVA